MIGLFFMALAVAQAPAAPAPDHQIIYSDVPAVRQIQDQIGWADAVVVGDTV